MVECQGEETTAAEATGVVVVWVAVAVVEGEGAVAEERSVLRIRTSSRAGTTYDERHHLPH